MVKIVIASTNKHKLEEINAINTNKNIEFEIIEGKFNPEENGKTFEENAVIKAKAAAEIVKTYCLADDSGLCVDYLNAQPGIYSSRYAPSAKERITKLLSEMNGVPFEKRGAHFTCSMVLVDKKGDVIHSETGRIFGFIDTKEKGENGFGYDPIFYIKELDKTMAQIPENEKNRISHRANALIPMLNWIEKNLL